MNLSAVLDRQNIVFDVQLNEKEAVLEYLTRVLYQSGNIESAEAFYTAVMEREAIAETGLGDGIAIPHGKHSTVKKASIAFARLHDYVEWESIDDQPVRYVFLLAIPENDKNNEHIAMLSELARSLIRKEVIEQVKHAQDVDTLLSVF